MAVLPSHHVIALASIECFGDDGTLDVEEVNFLLGLALRDDHVDEDEKRVLSSIFSKVERKDVDHRTWKRIEEVKHKHGID